MSATAGDGGATGKAEYKGSGRVLSTEPMPPIDYETLLHEIVVHHLREWGPDDDVDSIADEIVTEFLGCGPDV